MNKHTRLILALLGALGLNEINAREWRIPSPLSYGYAYSHYPFLPPIEENECNRCMWFDMINPWMAGEFRHINNAYVNDSTNKETLAALFFGAPSFNLANLVTPGTSTAAFPLTNFINIIPNFDYTENVAWFGLNLEKHFGCEGEWHVGLRLRIPYRDIKTQLDSCCALETLTGALQRAETDCTDDTTPGLIPNAFAYRLDLLTALGLVDYQNPAAPTIDDITIANVDVTNAATNPNGTPPVNVIQVPVGSVPSSPLALRQGMVPPGPTLPCDFGPDVSVNGATPPTLVPTLLIW